MQRLTRYLFIIIVMVMCGGCVSHQWVELPNSKGGHDTYHAYLEKGTILEVKTDGVGSIKWDTKETPSTIDQVAAIATMAVTNNMVKGD